MPSISPSVNLTESSWPAGDPSGPRTSILFTWQPSACRGRFLGQHAHIPEHVVVHEVRLHPANHEILARVREMDGLGAIAWVEAWIRTALESVVRIVDEGHSCWNACC